MPENLGQIGSNELWKSQAGRPRLPESIRSSGCSVWNYKIPTRAANFFDSPNASSRSVMFFNEVVWLFIPCPSACHAPPLLQRSAP
jgi:hypothetical protein